MTSPSLSLLAELYRDGAYSRHKKRPAPFGAISGRARDVWIAKVQQWMRRYEERNEAARAAGYEADRRYGH